MNGRLYSWEERVLQDSELCTSPLGPPPVLAPSLHSTRHASGCLWLLRTPPLCQRTFCSSQQPQPVRSLAHGSLHSLTPGDSTSFSLSKTEASGPTAFRHETVGRGSNRLKFREHSLGIKGVGYLGIRHNLCIFWRNSISFFLSLGWGEAGMDLK